MTTSMWTVICAPRWIMRKTSAETGNCYSTDRWCWTSSTYEEIENSVWASKCIIETKFGLIQNNLLHWVVLVSFVCVRTYSVMFSWTQNFLTFLSPSWHNGHLPNGQFPLSLRWLLLRGFTVQTVVMISSLLIQLLTVIWTHLTCLPIKVEFSTSLFIISSHL